MSAVTGIEWTDRTWNPVTGCSKVSPGCAHCYAEGIAKRLWPSSYPPIYDGAYGQPRARAFEDVQVHEDRLLAPLSWQNARVYCAACSGRRLDDPACQICGGSGRYQRGLRVFVNSMSDLFHEDVPDAFIDKIFAVMALTPAHTFQILTKRAERMLDYMRDPVRHHDVTMTMQGSAELGGLGFHWPANGRSYPRWPNEWPLKNAWLGVSVENQHFADERIPMLLQTPAAVRFISAEPLLGPVDLTRVFVCEGVTGWGPRTRHVNALDGWESDTPRGTRHPREHQATERHLDWVIVGGESGPGARPFDLAWGRSIVEQCKAAGVPVFVKQLGASPVLGGTIRPRTSDGSRWPTDRKGGDMAEWPDDLRVRQFPHRQTEATPV